MPEDFSVAKKIIPESMVCPKCRKPAMKYIEASGKLVCTNCGFEAAVPKAEAKKGDGV